MNSNKTYLLKYEVRFTDNSGLLGKEIKIKNCMSSLHAKIRLEEYCKKKYPNFKTLIVNTCTEDMMSIFGDIFGKGFGMFN